MNCHYSAQGDYKCTKPKKEEFGMTAAQLAAAKKAQIAREIVEKAAREAKEKAARAAADAADKIEREQRKAAIALALDRRYR